MGGNRPIHLSATASTLPIFLTAAQSTCCVNGKRALLLCAILGLLRIDDLIFVWVNAEVFLLQLGIVGIMLLICVSLVKLIFWARLAVNIAVSVKPSLIKNATRSRVFENLLPLVTNFLVLDLGEAMLNGLHELFFLFSFGKFECFLNDEVPVVVAHKSVKTLRTPDFADEA